MKANICFINMHELHRILNNRRGEMDPNSYEFWPQKNALPNFPPPSWCAAPRDGTIETRQCMEGGKTPRFRSKINGEALCKQWV